MLVAEVVVGIVLVVVVQAVGVMELLTHLGQMELQILVVAAVVLENLEIVRVLAALV
jgi:hypothetical protein